MFKEGDYIVALKIHPKFNGDTSKENFITKQKVDSEYLNVEKDIDNESNWNTNLHFSKKDLLLDWRYATKEEIAEYDRLGHGFDVTTLKSENWVPKVGDYVVITKSDENWVSSMNDFIGKCVQITWYSSDKNRIQFKDSKDFTWSYNQKHFRKATFEEITEHKRLGYDYFINDLNKSSIEFKEGNYYYCEYSKIRYIFQCVNLKNKQTFDTNGYIHIYDNSFNYKNEGKDFSGEKVEFKNVREATEEEKIWLEACILADKFISKEEALKSKSSEVKKDNPYISLLNKWCTNDDWIGKSICKASSFDLDGGYVYFSEAYTNLHKICDAKKWWIGTGFRLATEEEILDHLPEHHPDRLAILNKNKVEKELDKFPDKWCIKPKDKEEALVISKWFDENYSTSDNNFYESTCKVDSYYTNGFHKGKAYSIDKPSNIKEITYGQFKKHVLKEKDTDKSTSPQLNSLPDKYFVQPENQEQDDILIEFRGNRHAEHYKNSILVVDTNHKMFYVSSKKQEFIDKGYIELSFEEWYRLKFSTHIINKYNSILDNVISKTLPKLSFGNDIINYLTGVANNTIKLSSDNRFTITNISEDLIIEKQELLDTKVNKIKPVKIDLVDSKPNNVF